MPEVVWIAAVALTVAPPVAPSSIVLVSHGSKRPEAWSQLYSLSRALEVAVAADVTPASIFFGRRDPVNVQTPTVPPLALDAALRYRLQSSPLSRVVILPFVLGPSKALVVELPRVLEAVQEDFPFSQIVTAPCLSAADDGRVIPPQLAPALVEDVDALIEADSLRRPLVLLCDHGTADLDVARVRRRLAAQMADMLGDRVCGVEPAPMERPAALHLGEPADDLLLQERLERLPAPSPDVVVSMSFLSPGRHAGRGGDVERIIVDASSTRNDLRVHVTPLLGDHMRVRMTLARTVAKLANLNIPASQLGAMDVY